MKISIAIPYHGDRWRYVNQTIHNLKGDSRIEEVLIVDDASSPEHWEKLCRGVAEWPGYNIRVVRNAHNLFVFRNKRRAVELAASPWVCLLDSDNIIDPSYFDAVARHVRRRRDARTGHMTGEMDDRFVYLPEWARPSFDYRAFSGRTYNRATIAHSIDRPRFDCMLNTMNFVVNRDTFLRAMGPENQYEPKTADSIWINYRLVMAGCTLMVVPGMQYDHTIHAESTWKLHHAGEGDREAARIAGLFKTLR